MRAYGTEYRFQRLGSEHPSVRKSLARLYESPPLYKRPESYISNNGPVNNKGLVRRVPGMIQSSGMKTG